MAETIVAPAPETPVPAFPEQPTICARCPRLAELGHHLCADCVAAARFQANYELDLERRCGCYGWPEGVFHDV